MTEPSKTPRTPGQVLFESVFKHSDGTAVATLPSWEHCKDKEMYERIAADVRANDLQRIAELELQLNSLCICPTWRNELMIDARCPIHAKK